MRPPKGRLPYSGTTLFGALRRLVSEVQNWYTVGLLAWLVLPSRMPPRRGLPGSILGRRSVVFRFRDGSTIRCRLQDSEAVVSVRIQRDYDLPHIDWRSLNTIVDVGAHVGAFTVWAGLRSPDAKLIGVEPNPTSFSFLERNVPQPGFDGSNESFSVATRVGIGDGGGPEIDVLTLEDLFHELLIDRIDLLKMDCEGCEYATLLSAPEGLLKRLGVIVCEYHQMAGCNRSDIADRLMAMGFRVQMDASEQGLIEAWKPSFGYHSPLESKVD